MLWAYITKPKHSTSLSPFHLAYGPEEVMPTKYIMPISKTKCIEDGINEKLLSYDKAFLDETRHQAMEYMMKYQLDIRRSYGKRIK